MSLLWQSLDKSVLFRLNWDPLFNETLLSEIPVTAPIVVGLGLLAAALWSLYKVYNAGYYKPAEGAAVTLKTWIFTAAAIYAAVLGLWFIINSWRRSALAWRADNNGIHISRGGRPLRKINWSEIDTISSRGGFGHGAVIWSNGLKSKVKLPFVRRKSLVELIDLWKRFT